MSIVKLGKLSSVEALIALFNNAKPQGFGYFWYVHDHELSKEEAKSYLDKYEYIDYLEGRVIKVKFTKDATELDCTLYDRDNGEGSAERAIREYERVHYLEQTMDKDTTKELIRKATEEAAKKVLILWQIW